MISRRRLATALALALVVALTLSVRLSQPRLHTDEITYMSSALESMLHGSVFPVKGDGSLFVNKPPLALWLMRLSFEILGPSPFAARLPSVLAATATAAVLYLFGAAVFGEGVGIAAALLFVFIPGLLELHGIRSAVPDALEILLITSAIVLLEFWRRHRRPWMLPALVAVTAASAWVKSPFSLVVLLAYLLATELPARRAGHGTPRFGATVTGVAGAWIGAWLLWLGALSADTSPRAVATRLLERQYAQRIGGHVVKTQGQGPGYYLASVADDFGPLLLLPAGAAVAVWLTSRQGRLSSQHPSRHDVACLAVWSLAAPVLATASATKLPWYAYLSYPGIALALAVSARSLAQAVSGRRAVQSALLTATVLVLVWRLPAGRVWPAEAQYRGPGGRLWEIAGHDRIAVVPGPRFQALRQRNDAAREDWLFIRMLFWQSRGSADPGPCRAMLVNRRRDAPAPGEALELRRTTRKGIGLFLVDGCDGRLREVVSEAHPE